MVVDHGLRWKRLCLATCGRLWCLCFSVLNSFRLMAEFSTHKASAMSDTDVPWTSIAVMIRRRPAFDSGSCNEQRKGSLLFVLGPDPGFATASSISDLGAMSVTWHCDSLESNDWQGRGSQTCVQIFRCLKSIRGLKRLSRSFPMRSGYVLSVDTYTGWTRSMGPTVKWIGTTCFSCRPTWEYAWRFSSHLWSLRVPLVLFVLSWTSLRSSVHRVMSAPVSRRASILRCRSMMTER